MPTCHGGAQVCADARDDMPMHSVAVRLAMNRIGAFIRTPPSGGWGFTRGRPHSTNGPRLDTNMRSYQDQINTTPDWLSLPTWKAPRTSRRIRECHLRV